MSCGDVFRDVFGVTLEVEFGDVFVRLMSLGTSLEGVLGGKSSRGTFRLFWVMYLGCVFGGFWELYMGMSSAACNWSLFSLWGMSRTML